MLNFTIAFGVIDTFYNPHDFYFMIKNTSTEMNIS